ncbi:MAG: ribonuclease H-like domain-containing protein [Candidatus Eisenbacteria bacterium]|nr:ribonuclease H-like domain-containing protein [Candidatus Eisenbacteria bacterium]MCC7140912.1 ribonuclease H-like domain-containing protein [Candidatus Eisenbacteria bacterium]
MHASLATAFPLADFTRPGDAYLRLVHPLRGRDELLSLGEETLCFDLETLGFVGRPIFLVGFLVVEGGVPSVVQLLACDYTEEESILSAYAEEAARRPLWGSFNGKSFDLPSLRRRCAYYGLKLPEPREHRDLLFPARKVYRGVLPNCRLKTLESRVFGHHRSHDLEGGEIPPAYHAFVRTGAPGDLLRILLHNREDLVTLARLWLHLEEPEPGLDARLPEES